jgi:hypothetical protein
LALHRHSLRLPSLFVETPPEILYYFSNPRGIPLLSEQRVLVKPATEQNDPFELAIAFGTDATEAEIRAFYESPHNQARIIASLPPEIDVLDFLRRSRQRLPQIVRAAYLDQHAMAQSIQMEFRTLAAEFFLFCGTEDWRNQLLWAHYTGAHTGFAVGFDSMALARRVPGTCYRRVNYSTTRPLMEPIVRPTAREAMEQQIIELLATKSTEWAVEKAWRLILIRPMLEAGTLENGQPGRFLPFDPTCIREVTLGFRCSESERIRNILDEPRSEHVNVYEARPHHQSYDFDRSLIRSGNTRRE